MTAGRSGERIVIFDDFFFTFGLSGIGKLWSKFWSIAYEYDLFAQYNIKPYLLSRSNLLTNFFDYGEALWTPPGSFAGMAHDVELLGQVIKRIGSDSTFLSSYYTFPLQHSSSLLVYDLIPELLYPNEGAPGWIQRRLAVHAAGHFGCISSNTRDDLIRLYSQVSETYRSVVLYPGVDENHFHPCSDHEAECLDDEPWLSGLIGRGSGYVVYVGGMAIYKNFDLFLDALLQMEAPPRQVFITGVDFSPDVIGRCAERDIEIFFVSPNEKTYGFLIRHAQFVVYPSLYEGFGLPVAEAIASRVKVLVSAGSSLDEFVSPYVIRFDGRCPGSLRRGMERILCGGGSEGFQSLDECSDSIRWPNDRSWLDFSRDLVEWISESPEISSAALNRHSQIKKYLDLVANLPN